MSTAPITVLGIDLAKDVFQLPKCKIVMEACMPAILWTGIIIGFAGMALILKE